MRDRLNIALNKDRPEFFAAPAVPVDMSIDADIQRWIRPEILGLTAYQVPDATGLVKLDAMENPYTLPASVIDDWVQLLRQVTLNRYPDPEAGRLKDRLRALFQVPPGSEILLGNGSDELIQLIALAIAAPGRVLLAPEPSFSMYRMIAMFAGLEYVAVPLAADFDLDCEAMLSAIATHGPAVVFLDFPNNPSGKLFARDRIHKVIEAAPGLVVIDEAYHTFSGATFMSELERHSNLLVLRTLSKMGLAGLRLGLLAGHRRWLGEINKIRLPYNVGVLTQASADFVLGHEQVFAEQSRAICADREWLQEKMAALPGISVYPSRANFILFRVPAGRSKRIFDALKAKGVLIKGFFQDRGVLADCLRVTVGLPEENQAFLSALSESL